MQERSQSEHAEPRLREKITGLGERSIRKSYYPQLRQKLDELEKAHKELAVSEARYRSLVENITEVIVSLDAGGSVIYISPAIQNLCGLTPEQITGQKLTKFVHPSDRCALAARLESALAGGLEFHEFRLLDKEGAIRWLRISSRPLMEAGHAVRLTCVMRDITARKLAEDALRKLNDELEQRVAERTAGLERANQELEWFAYSVSHDLRTALRAIDGFSHILLEDYKDTLAPDAQRYLSLVCESAARMGRLIDDILAFSRVLRGGMSMARVNMTALAEEVFAELRAAATGRDIRFVLGELPPARGDAAMIRQVLVNLLGNAVKYTRSRPDAVIEMSGTESGSENVYCVKDNGAGFDMRYAGKLFGVFQRLHSVQEFEGTGIGLAIVKRIVERHGGEVRAEGKVGEGATFYFTFPHGEDEASSPSSVTHPAS